MADGSFDCFELAIADGDDDLYMDLDTIYSVLDENCDPSESSHEDSSMKNTFPGKSGINNNFQLQSGNSVLDCDQGPPSQTCPSPHAFPDSFGDLVSLSDSHGICYKERPGVSEREMLTHSVEPGASEAHLKNISFCGGDLNLGLLCNGESVNQFKHVGEEVESEDASHSPIIEDIDVNFGHYGAFYEDIIGGISEHQENDSCASFEITFMNADRSSHIAASTNSTICQGSNIPSDYGDHHSSLFCSRGTYDRPFVADSSIGYLPNVFCWPNEETRDNISSAKVESLADISRANSNMHSSTNGGIPLQDNQCMLVDVDFSSIFPPYMSSEDQVTYIKDERDELISPYQNFTYKGDAELSVGQELKQMPGIFPSAGCQSYGFVKHEDNDTVIGSEGAHHYQDIVRETASKFPGNMGNLSLEALCKSLPHSQSSIASEKQFDSVKGEGVGQMIEHKSANCHISKVSTELFHRDFLEKSHVEDDYDVCIVEKIGHPAPTSGFAVLGSSLNVSQCSTHGDSQPYIAGGTRLKACDERDILRVALQDLSQPKSEVSPPDGLLAVSLLRHQRIALSWMVQKETSSVYCSGGILADDQGLGKTVSTIALILKERPQTFSACNGAQKGELETLNLDVDDDMVPENGGMKKETNTCLDMSNRCPNKSINLSMQAKGRPSAGTLIVCPTSVLRQWAEELHNKVTSKASLSVLVYHGSNRTKDPYDLAKYDVVLTTYSIVSMEVPKQPLVDKDDDENGISEEHVSNGCPPSRKRKSPSRSGKSSKKGMEGTLLEAAALPLAKVAWFRVVLDEAQSIKNHRTQVARACCGLRAKRRWCLSGTPIQNAIDDLYSYFRFLRYDPYAIYASFCATIKAPISRNPNKGYKKLQAVLKTIMLRRTKGTLLDGEPIITLPPKFVELKKVDFSQEERDFYSRLEANSRAQFQEYADAGTVKQNYVNILLMLLRLRQACDHPLLVKCYNSNSLWRSSVEMAKKLTREKQIFLLKCLEASLALCGICNQDAPEDAVVSVCGHVFCNQCICEHLTGDENQCPATDCKAQLNISSVFSKDTLNSSLSDTACDDSIGCSGFEVEEFEPCSQSQLCVSSKIKAALEVLHSLCKPKGHTSKNNSMQSTFRESSDCPKNSSDASQCLPGDRGSKDSITVVGEKAIVFSQWTRMLDLLEVCLKNSSIQYRRLDGTMSVVARDKAVKDFNTLPEVSVIIMSLKAASLGLNMVAACHVLLLDLWWNPTTEDQAIDRAHRIGQTRPVTVLRLTVRDTVEDRILALQQKKRKMVASAFGEDGTGGRQSRLTGGSCGQQKKRQRIETINKVSVDCS